MVAAAEVAVVAAVGTGLKIREVLKQEVLQLTRDVHYWAATGQVHVFLSVLVQLVQCCSQES